MAEVSEAATPKKRGRPKGSPNKTTLLKKAAPPSDTPKRARGRPKKAEDVNGTPRTPGKRGRPKGSRNKKPNPVGRPRKNPLPPAGERKKPKVWKPLGRPRKYPRADDADGPSEKPQRGRGRPPKAGSKRTQPKKENSTDGPPRKRGRPKKSAVAGEPSAVAVKPESTEEMDASE